MVEASDFVGPPGVPCFPRIARTRGIPSIARIPKVSGRGGLVFGENDSSDKVPLSEGARTVLRALIGRDSTRGPPVDGTQGRGGDFDAMRTSRWKQSHRDAD
jgi:hypothetical protein